MGVYQKFVKIEDVVFGLVKHQKLDVMDLDYHGSLIDQHQRLTRLTRPFGYAALSKLAKLAKLAQKWERSAIFCL